MFHIIPSRQSRPSDDPIFALNREANERRGRGESIINATLGVLSDDDGKLAILPTVTQVLAEVGAEDWAAYAPIAGTSAFLQAVMNDTLGAAPELRKAAVAVATPGGTGALRHAIANFLEPSQALVTTNYYWGPYQTLADEADRKVATFPMFTPDGRFDGAALERALCEQANAQGRLLIVLNDPCHNPTGYSMQEEDWQHVAASIAKYADRVPITLLIDMAYAAYAPNARASWFSVLPSLLGKAALAFAWSASKTFTHYGLRVGALIVCIADAAERKATESALVYSCRGTWSNCNRGGLHAITRLLSDDALSVRCNRERESLKAMLSGRVDAFNRLARPRGLAYPRYEGGFFVTVFHDDAHRKAEQMRTQHGVFVVPQKGALRVALCSVAERDVARLVDALVL